MADFRFDEGSRFAENCEAFLEGIKAERFGRQSLHVSA